MNWTPAQKEMMVEAGLLALVLLLLALGLLASAADTRQKKTLRSAPAVETASPKGSGAASKPIEFEVKQHE